MWRTFFLLYQRPSGMSSPESTTLTFFSFYSQFIPICGKTHVETLCAIPQKGNCKGPSTDSIVIYVLQKAGRSCQLSWLTSNRTSRPLCLAFSHTLPKSKSSDCRSTCRDVTVFSFSKTVLLPPLHKSFF